jgi:hypothetical protein
MILNAYESHIQYEIVLYIVVKLLMLKTKENKKFVRFMTQNNYPNSN